MTITLEHNPAAAEPATSPFLNEQQASARLGLSPKTLRNWRSAGSGPGYLRLGSAVRYHLETLDEWALAQEVAA